MKRHDNTANFSVVYRITITVSIIAIASLLVIITTYFYSMNRMKENEIEAKKNTLNIYTNDMDNILQHAVDDLDTVVRNTEDFSLLGSEEDNVRYFFSMQVKDEIEKRMQSSAHPDGLLVYNEKSKVLLSTYSSRITVEDKANIEEALSQEKLIGAPSKEPWKVYEVHGKFFFYKMYAMTETKVLAIVTPKYLMSLIDESLDTDDYYIMKTSKGTEIDSRIHEDVDITDDAVSLSKPLEGAEAALTAVININSTMMGFTGIEWIIFGLAGMMILVMPFFIIFMIREIIRPINQLILGFANVEKGNWTYRVPINERSKEFVRLKQAFNNMILEIKYLKIAHYEEQIELQKTELKFLQSQLKPHFMMNAMTTIHSMTYQGELVGIREYVDALSVYFRYIVNIGQRGVTLAQEIHQLKNYLTMQDIRFPGSVFYFIDIQDELLDIEIPQLLLVTLVENTIKHAMTLEEPLTLYIRGKQEYKDGGSYMQIDVEDNGEGFEKNILDWINDSMEEAKPEHAGIGLVTIKKTIRLLYGEKGKLRLSQASPHGGVVTVIIPIRGEL